MVRGATSKAFLDSCFEGRRTSKGFVNDQPGQKYKPGFRVVDGTTLNDVPEPDPEARLAELLVQLGSTVDVLPAQARAALALRKSYTVAKIPVASSGESSAPVSTKVTFAPAATFRAISSPTSSQISGSSNSWQIPRSSCQRSSIECRIGCRVGLVAAQNRLRSHSRPNGGLASVHEGKTAPLLLRVCGCRPSLRSPRFCGQRAVDSLF